LLNRKHPEYRKACDGVRHRPFDLERITEYKSGKTSMEPAILMELLKMNLILIH